MAPADDYAGPAPASAPAPTAPGNPTYDKINEGEARGGSTPSASLKRTSATRKRSSNASILSAGSQYSDQRISNAANKWGMDTSMLDYIHDEPSSYGLPDQPTSSGRPRSSTTSTVEIPRTTSPDLREDAAANRHPSSRAFRLLPVIPAGQVMDTPSEYSRVTTGTAMSNAVEQNRTALPLAPAPSRVMTGPNVSFSPGTPPPLPGAASSLPAPINGDGTPPVLRPILTTTPFVPGPSTAPVHASSSSRPKPQLRLSTQELPAPLKKEDKPPVSPGMKHWQQVRQHVITAPSPIEERQPPKQAKKPGLVSRTAGRFGFRNVVENVLGYDRRRGSTYGAFQIDGLTDEEREEASRQRRRFARDIKACLDACSAEESRRRLRRLAAAGGQLRSPPPSSTKPKSTHQSAHGYNHKAMSTHSSAFHLPAGAAGAAGDELSAFGPLLIELHKFVHDARAKRLWSRTCPHHAAILAELGTTFLPDSASTDGERAQTLEVFRTIINNWSTDGEDDELDRWMWLCRAMLIDDRALRNRGLALLSQLLRKHVDIPESLVRPDSALDFESVAIALLTLLHALESAPYASDQQQSAVWDLLADLSTGDIIKVDPDSLLDLLNDMDVDTARHIETELLWLAAAKVIATDRHVGAWLLDRDAAVLKRFAPPPVLPGMPGAVRRLRVLASNKFFASFAALVRDVDDEDVVSAVARMARGIYEEAVDLRDHVGVVAGYASLLLALDCAANDGGYGARLRDLLAEYKSVTSTIAKSFVSSFPATQTIKTTRQFLQTDLAPLGRACVPPLLEHLATLPPDPEARSFLAWLATSQPQLFYKPLFACAAATQAETLSNPLRGVQRLSEQLGPEVFWTRADPQMIAIVLVGDVAPRPGKGKGKAGAPAVVHVKLGRYAILVELVIALHAIKGTNPQLGAFARALETRLGAMLEIEERDSPLPAVYRSLVAQLVRSLRVASGLIKRTAATRISVQWYTSPSWRVIAEGLEASQVEALTKLYKTDTDSAVKNAARIATLQVPLSESLPTLLVVVQASLGSEDWGALLPVVWERYVQMGQPVDQLTFLMMKCAESARGGLRNLVSTELFNAGPSVRGRALLKLAMLYGYRFQVYTQKTVTDKRWLNFRFPHRTLEFVMADMGSLTWVTPRDAQDAALQKYGRSLPLELRQRLMELGWTEDEEMTASDIERVPVTAVPPTGKGAATVDLRRSPNSAPPAMKRKGSDSSLHSNAGKVHRAVVPPDLVAIVIDQARLLATSDDIPVELLSKELVLMFERDDPTVFMRPVSESLSRDIGNALTRLNAVIAQPTPGFSYTALNAMVGYLKTAVRNDMAFTHWAPLLGTIARVIPHVCEISLRDVRKTKAEHVLLPASIYETEGGFKLHRPWQEDVLLDVQTAQLILLASMLRANPRDVYLIKKMLFNLQVQESMRYLPFARAWIELIVDLFMTVNSNYNDRAELRHFLYNINAALTLHGTHDLIVAAHAMRALSLCATRFRRVFASIGFVSIMQPVYSVYVKGHEGIKDAVEYACRSFYRIHQDVFVYQLCLALADKMADMSTFDAKPAYNLLACLSPGDQLEAGVPSGIRGLNDKAEIEALVQMLSGGAEVSLSELGTRAAASQEQRAATLSLEPVVFPTDNIIRLLVTVIAVNAASRRAIRLMDLFAAIAPHMRAAADGRSLILLAEAVDVIGQFIQRMRVSDDTALQRLLPGDEASRPDWPAARRAYVHLVDAFSEAGGSISVQATRRLLDIVMQVLHDEGGNPRSSATASNILGALARSHLAAQDATGFLEDLVPAYRQRIATVDFSGVLEASSALIRRSAFNLSPALSRLVVHDYIGPAIRMLALASDESMAFVVPLRKATVELLSLAVFLPGVDALSTLEHVAASAGLLAGVVLPFVLLLEKPHDVDRDDMYAGLWVRILRLTLRPARGPPTAQAAQAALALQIVKVVAVRVPDAISGERGLWAYLASYIKVAVDDGNGRFFTHDGQSPPPPRIIDWMMWSLFELLSLYRMPIALALRLRIQQALAAIADEREQGVSRPSTAGSGSSAPGLAWYSPVRSLSGLVRRPSARIASGSSLSPLAANRATSLSPKSAHSPLSPVPERRESTLSTGASGLSPLSPHSPNLEAPASPSPSTPTHPPTSSFPLPITRLVHGRSISTASAASGVSATSVYSTISLSTPPSHRREASSASRRSYLATSASSATGLPPPIRPSFTALSARRASRPVFEPFDYTSSPTSPSRPRFPSAAPRPGERGAIVHLLGPASVAAATATGSGPASLALATSGDPKREALRSRVKSDVLAAATRRGLLVTLVVYGYDVEEEVEVHAWSAPDALHSITEQTRALVEDELTDVFNPPPATRRLSRADLDVAGKLDDSDGEKSRPTSKHSAYSNPWEDETEQLPALSYTLNHGFDEGYSLTTDMSGVSAGRCDSLSPGPGHNNITRDISAVPVVAISHA